MMKYIYALILLFVCVVILQREYFEDFPSDAWRTTGQPSNYDVPVYRTGPVAVGDYWKPPILPTEYDRYWPNGYDNPDYIYPGQTPRFRNRLWEMGYVKKVTL
jgi:hypothetical protein